jgi:hypothetical protein
MQHREKNHHWHLLIMTVIYQFTDSLYNTTPFLFSLIFRKWVYKVRFEVLTVMSMKMAVLWDVPPCSLVDIDPDYHSTTSQKTAIFKSIRYLKKKHWPQNPQNDMYWWLSKTVLNMLYLWIISPCKESEDLKKKGSQAREPVKGEFTTMHTLVSVKFVN